MLAWNIANVWESVAMAQPGHATIVQGEDVWSSARLDEQAEALAATLLRAGLGHQSKVAVYLHNCPQFLVAYLGACKVGLVPLNVNFRYEPSELLYLLDNSDAEAVVFEAAFAPKLAGIRQRLPNVKLWLAVGADVPPWSVPFDTLAAHAAGRVRAPWGRSADDILLLYTGGTTGAPKGVMWRQEDLLGVGGFGASPLLGIPSLTAPEEAGPRAQRIARPVVCIACPLMHGTGLLTAIGTLNIGGTLVLLQGHALDAEALWDQVERWQVTRVSIVGQAFAMPLLEALDRHPRRWDLRALKVIGSSGAMWSRENKQGILHHLPWVTLADAFSSSEAIGLGTALANVQAERQTAHFALGPNCAVFADDNRRVTAGSGERGRVAVTGHIPLGYYKDPVKTAQAFPTIEGQRWSMPGDYAEVNTDGTLTLLGRGSQCINTGGEKVFPEEVEEALKRFRGVRDAAVVGLPDERFGERICAVVEVSDAALATEAALIAHVKSELAAYKAPRHVFMTDRIDRGPNGKLDYPATKQFAHERFVALERRR